MKRINYAGPVKKQLISSDHKTIKLTIKIARNLKKSQPRPEEADLSQIGTKFVAAPGGGTKEVPNQHTTNLIDAANAIFESIDIGPFQSTAQETDKMYAAVVKALIETSGSADRLATWAKRQSPARMRGCQAGHALESGS